MLLEPLSINGKPQAKCFAKECTKCNFYRRWRVVEDLAKVSERPVCSWEAVFRTISALVGTTEGLQAGVEETRNRTTELRAIFDGAPVIAIKGNNYGVSETQGAKIPEGPRPLIESSEADVSEDMEGL